MRETNQLSTKTFELQKNKAAQIKSKQNLIN